MNNAINAKLVHLIARTIVYMHPRFRSIIACISPVVPINCILALTKEGYGEDKEIGTLLFAAASIDDIHIVSVYSICYSFIFTHGTVY